MTAIYVDADACPVKAEVLRVATRHGVDIHMVSNSWMRLDDSPLIHRVVVSDGFDAADDWIVENIAAGDVAITSDIPLAARCLEKGAEVIGPTGRPFNGDNIGSALATRDLMSHLRDIGEVRGGGPPFSKGDRSQFLQELEKILHKIKRQGVGNAP
ncbi:MAG: YaiI/YqxD family protein [Alphaproteobacteria bacterium]|nr:YaiI/YqxD family protein [Alphaproteobacteria bacterium]